MKARIAHLLPWEVIGGTEIATIRAARAATEMGASCRLFLPEGALELDSRCRAEGLETEFYSWAEPSLRRPAAYWRANRELAAALRRWRADLLHCAEVLGAFRVSLSGRMAGIPVLCHVRSRQTEFSRRDQIFLRPVDHYVFVSEATRRAFGVRRGSRSGSVLYDAVDRAEPPSSAERAESRRAMEELWGIPEGAPLVGMAGRVEPPKDLATLLGAARRTLESVPDAWFVVIGAVGATQRGRDYFATVVEPLLADPILKERVVFTGFRSDAVRWMGALDVFVLTSHFEGFPLVLLEAMARGVPVCGTAVDGVPEALADGAGWLHEREDQGELSRQFVELLQNPVRSAELGAAGRRRVETVFSPERYARELEALYTSLIRST